MSYQGDFQSLFHLVIVKVKKMLLLEMLRSPKRNVNVTYPYLRLYICFVPPGQVKIACSHIRDFNKSPLLPFYENRTQDSVELTSAHPKPGGYVYVWDTGRVS